MAAEECAICWEPMKRSVKIACGHEFCFVCLKNMQARGAFNCPLCRAESHIIANLRSRCPAKGKNGVARVSVKRPRKEKTSKRIEISETIVLSDDATIHIEDDNALIPRGKCQYCNNEYELSYLHLHSRCDAHPRQCGGCSFLPRSLGLAGNCVLCFMHELGMERREFQEMLQDMEQIVVD